MAVNSLFSLNENFAEQNLWDSIVQESIQMHGLDVFYLVRDTNTVNRVFGEARNSSFVNAHQIEMYVRSVDNFEGEGDLMSKFGFQVRDAMTLTVSNTSFEESIGQNEGFTRPREGDVIYFPLNKKLWEIRHVEHEANFYALGKLYTCDLRCELFEFSGEQFLTGEPVIDELANRFDYSQTTVEDIDDIDPGADNTAIEEMGHDILDFRETNIFGDERY